MDTLDEEEKLSKKTILSIEDASVNSYEGALTLNVNSGSTVQVNPTSEEVQFAGLTNINDSEISFNLSQRSCSSDVVYCTG